MTQILVATLKFINSPRRYLAVCVTLLVILVGMNSFFFIMKEALGFGGGTFLFFPQDRFADIIKTALSYKAILLRNADFFVVINKLEPLYRDYYFNNPYAGIAHLDSLTHFHLTPETTLLNLLVGVAISHGVTPRVILIALFCTCMGLVFVSTLNIVRSAKKSLALLVLVICCYPLLFIVTRGNYPSFFCGIGVIALLNSLFFRNKVDWFSTVLFAVAVNIRPNAALMVLAVPLFMGIRKSVKTVFTIGALSAAIYGAAYGAVTFIYPDYTLASFLKAVKVYSDLYIIGNGGTAFNSSLYGMIKIAGMLVGLGSGTIMRLYQAVTVILLLLLVRLILKENARKAYLPFVLSSMYILLNPVACDYHLLLFVIPIFTAYCEFDLWKKDQVALAVVSVSTILILAPKNYLFVHGYSPQVILNPLIMLVTTAFLYYKNEISADSRFLVERQSILHEPL